MVGPVLSLLLLLLPPPPVRAPDDAAALRAQAREILERGDYQQEMPAEGEDEVDGDHFEGVHVGGGGFAISPSVVLITIGSVLLVLLAVGLQRHDATAETRRAGGTAAQSPLDLSDALPLADVDFDALAAEGRFADAIHVLLLRALRDVARARGEFARGTTSREVVARVGDAGAHASLAELVATAERHEFGGRELGRVDFERCRAAAEDVRARLTPAARTAA